MTMPTKQEIKDKAKALRENLGGTIFAFPIEENNPFSEYAVVVFQQGEYFVYPQASDISLAANGVMHILDLFKKEGIEASYENDVRFISHQAQMDAPNVTMRRLKKESISKPLLQNNIDVKEGIERDNPILSARGTLKISYLSMVDDHMPKASMVMDEYYKFLAMKRYGKTAAAIKREVSKMGKEQAIAWIEQTYTKFVNDPMDIFNLFNNIATK